MRNDMLTVFIMSIATSLLLIAYVGMRTTLNQCPRTALVANFDSSKYLGVWYEMYRAKSVPFETGECVTAQYSLKPDFFLGKNVVNVQNIQYFTDISEKNLINGKAFQNTFTPGKLYVSFFAEFGGDYRILDTDYTSYAIVYSCSTIFAGSISFAEYAWVLTRNPLTSSDPAFATITAKAKQVLAD